MPKSQKGLKAFPFAFLVGLTAVIFISYKYVKGDRTKGLTFIENTAEHKELSIEDLKQTPISELNILAKNGNVNATRYLAACYQLGSRGLQKDIGKALELFTKAAEEGSPEAALMVWLINESPDVPQSLKNLSIGKKWLIFAADRGNSDAESFLGQELLGLYGGIADRERGFSYLLKASQKGNMDATYWVAECYANGWGTKPNPVDAIRLLKASSDSDENFPFKPIAQQKLAEAYKYGYGVTKNMKVAFEYFIKSACLGNESSQVEVVRSYIYGEGVVPNTATALMWVYVNRAMGEWRFSDKLVSVLEQEFNSKELFVLRNAAQEAVAEIDKNKTNQSISAPKMSQTSSKAKSTGTGVLISPNGLIVTAGHVVEGANKLVVVLPDGKKEARILEIDAKNDLALIRIFGSGYSSAPLAPSRDIKLGQEVFTIGFPNTEIQGANPKFTKGEISSISGIRDEPTQWQISVPVQSGNSGSPLFDESGNMVGIVVSKLNALETAKTTGDLVQNVNYAVKNAYLIPMLEKFTDKLPSPKQRGLFKKFESVVEDSKKTVVLILAY